MWDDQDSNLLVGLTAAGALIVGTAVFRKRRVARQIREYTDQIVSGSSSPDTEPYHPDDVADLPSPVRWYFETVLQPGQRHVETVRLAQEGEFRLGGADAAWYPCTAEQVYSVSPPRYAWDGRIEMVPLVETRVLDAYVAGEGLLRANLLGAIPVASEGPDPEMNEAELQRYLAETPWFPTALLPAAGVTWAGIDDQTARATLTDGDVTATATFHFDDDGYLGRITANRYRRDEDATAQWVGEYRAYEERDGMTIPTRAEVGWRTDERVVPYWRGRISEITYQSD